MLKIRKILSRNQKGFSLIELMIAVAILALVAIGLFQAFTTAFQSMNDSKDRTIATNYAQEILEVYKNIAFEKVQPFSDTITGTKFYKNVSVQQVSDKLKKVVVQIDWDDRNSRGKIISLSTLIYDDKSTAEVGSTPAAIVIYADRYNLLPGNDDRAQPSHIYAEIVDKNGDLITDWDDSNIYFEVEYSIDFVGDPLEISYLGSLRNYSVIPVLGKADTYYDQYDAEERQGFVSIKASLTVEGIGELYDSLTLKITNEAVSVILTTDKEIISTKGGEDGTASITATIVDASFDLDNPVLTDQPINFSLISGPGSLINYIPTNNGVAYIDLISGTATGTATITAISGLLEPDSIDIQIVNLGLNKIEVEAESQTIVQQGSTDIIATLTDYLGNPVPDEEIIFTIDNSALGNLSPENVTTGTDGKAVSSLTMYYGGTATITASWEAEDSTIVSDTVSVVCRNHNLYVYPDPPTISEGGLTTIYAELTNASGSLVEGENINFIILEGNGYLNSNSDTTNELGIASVTLNIDSEGITTVEANWQGDPTVVLGEAEVECTSAPVYQVDITAEKTTISVGEDVNITATLTENGIPVSGIDVEFSLDDYSNAKLDNNSSSVIKTTDVNGEATVVLSDLTAGESVTVTAESEGASDSITISCEVPEITIALDDPPNIKHGKGRWGRDEIYFNIIVTGSNINLDRMIVSWQDDNNEKLINVYIDDDEVYYNTNGADNNTTIFFNQVDFYNLEIGNTYTFKIEFDSEILDKDWTITFVNPTTGQQITPVITFYLN